MKTSIKTLELLCAQINTLTGSPAEPYTYNEAEGRNYANIGNYNISQQNGGVCLHRIGNASGGITTPLVGYHVPKKELECAMRGFIAGLEAKA